MHVARKPFGAMSQYGVIKFFWRHIIVDIFFAIIGLFSGAVSLEDPVANEVNTLNFLENSMVPNYSRFFL